MTRLLFQAIFSERVVIAHKATIPQRRATSTFTPPPRKSLSSAAPHFTSRIAATAKNPTEGKYKNRYAMGLISGIILATGTKAIKNHATKKTAVFSFRQILYVKNRNRANPAHAAPAAGGAYNGGRTLTVNGKINPERYWTNISTAKVA